MPGCRAVAAVPLDCGACALPPFRRDRARAGSDGTRGAGGHASRTRDGDIRSVHMRSIATAVFGASLVSAAAAQPASPKFADGVKQYIRSATPRIVLCHVRIIDGTGKPASDDQNLTIETGKLAAIGPGVDVAPAPDPTVFDMSGRTVLPGIVGMHEHMYYIARPNFDQTGRSEEPLVCPQMTFSAPRLYLAAGLTTVRTGGCVEGATDINLRDLIDAGRLVGPHMDV